MQHTSTCRNAALVVAAIVGSPVGLAEDCAWETAIGSPGVKDGEAFMGTMVRTLAVFDDGTGPALYAGGSFKTMGGIVVNNIARWDGGHWSALGAGLDGAFGPQVNDLAVYDDG